MPQPIVDPPLLCSRRPCRLCQSPRNTRKDKLKLQLLSLVIQAITSMELWGGSIILTFKSWPLAKYPMTGPSVENARNMAK